MASAPEQPVSSPPTWWQRASRGLWRVIVVLWGVILVAAFGGTAANILTTSTDTPLTKLYVIHWIIAYYLPLLVVAGVLLLLTVVSWIGSRERKVSLSLSPDQQDRVDILKALSKAYTDELAASLQGIARIPERVGTHRKAVIITTIAVEYNAVRAHIQNLREIDNGRILGETGHFAGNDATWDVIIFQVSPGDISMAAETERIINSLQPDIALLIDIAVGTKEVHIGDVVVAEKVYGYESGKAWVSRLLTRPEVEKPSYSLLERARAEAGKLDWLRRLPKDFHGIFAPPRVLLAPIASGEKELSSTQPPLFRFLNAFYEDALAIEMAGRGFLKAAPINSREVEALVICGIARQVDARRQEQEMHLLHEFAPAQDGSTLAAQRASAFAFQVLAKLGPQATRERPKKSSELTIAGLLVNENDGLTALDITLSNQAEQSIVVSGIQIDVLDVGVFSLCTNPISSGLRAVNIASAAYHLELFPALKGKSKTRYISHTLQPGETELIRLYLNQNEVDPQQIYAWYCLKITLLSSQQPLEAPQPLLLSIPPVNRAMMQKVWFSGNSACDEPNRIILQRLATLPSIKSATVEDVIARF